MAVKTPNKVAVQKVSTGRRLFDFYSKEFPTYFVIGRRRHGKSVFVEWAAEKFYEHGYLPIDLFDAGDYESCYWAIPNCITRDCNTPLGMRKHCTFCNTILKGNWCSSCNLYFDVGEWTWKYLTKCPKCGVDVENAKTDYKIIFVYPTNAKVESSNERILPMCCDLGLEVILRKAMKEKRIISIAAGLFTPDELYFTLADWLFQLIDLKRDKIRRSVVLIIREAANAVFSSIKTSQYQTELKRSIINLIRLAGHYQTVILFDTQRFKDLHVAARDVVETVVIKRHVKHGMPDIVQQVYKDLLWRRAKKKEKGADPYLLKRFLTLPTELFKEQFIVRFDDGFYTKSRNGMPKFHHKGPEDYFLDYSGLNVSKEPHRFLARDAQTIREVPKQILKTLAHTMVEKDGIDPELVAEWMNFAPATIQNWVRQEERRLTD